jgi:hypothetical protein
MARGDDSKVGSEFLRMLFAAVYRQSSDNRKIKPEVRTAVLNKSITNTECQGGL